MASSERHAPLAGDSAPDGGNRVLAKSKINTGLALQKASRLVIVGKHDFSVRSEPLWVALCVRRRPREAPDGAGTSLTTSEELALNQLKKLIRKLIDVADDGV